MYVVKEVQIIRNENNVALREISKQPVILQNRSTYDNRHHFLEKKSIASGY